jgi:hypothetical protein
MAAAPDVSKQGTRQERDRITRPFSTAPIVAVENLAFELMLRD